jgi:MarR family
VAEWSFLTNHARVLLCIAHDPGARLRDIAASLGITERTAHGIITDLAQAGYVLKQKDGRRNRYRIQAALPLREPASQEPAIGEVLAVLLGTKNGLPGLADLAAAGRLDGGPADSSDVVTLRAGGPGGLDGDDAPGATPPENDLHPGDYGRGSAAGRADGVPPRHRRSASASRSSGTAAGSSRAAGRVPGTALPPSWSGWRPGGSWPPP